MSGSGLGALLGMLCACGLLAVVARLRQLRGPDLLARISPFVPAAARVEHERQADPSTLQVATALLSGLITRRDASPGLDVRLARAGLDDPSAHQLHQAMAAGLGAAGGILLAATTVATGAPPVLAILLPVLGAIGGVLAVRRRLVRRGRMRARRIARQLPFVADLMAFAVAAGETPVAAMARVADTCDGPLAAEWRTGLADIRSGLPTASALQAVSARCGSPEVERFIDGLVMALERGTPVAELLRAQAADARADQRRLLLEQAGRREIAMLVPVVFLILPTVVLIAIFPGIHGLELIV